MDKIAVVLVDDHAATRQEMLALLNEDGRFRVVGEAATGKEGVELASMLHPDVIIMDLVMPGMNGIEATRAILAIDPAARVLALSNHTGDQLVRALRQVGAVGYVRKDQAYEELIPAIRAVVAGREYVGSRVRE